MKIDLSLFEAPEGFPKEALNNPAFAEFIEGQATAQLNVHKADYTSQLSKLTRDKAIADEKVSDLHAKLDEAKKAGSGDADIDKIKAQLAKAKDEAALEYRGQIDAIKAEKDALYKENEATKQTLTETELKHFLRSGLAEHNDKYKALAAKSDSGAQDYLIEKALKDWKKGEDGKYKAYNSDGTPMTSAEGAISKADYFADLRGRPETAFCFNQPTGGGATGGSGGGATDDWSKHFDPKTINLTKQAELARTDPALFNQLSQKKR